MSATETLLIELGTEELPPKALKTLGLAFRDGIVAGLAQRGLEHTAVQWFATPRRLAVLIEQVSLQAPDREQEIQGPPADKARDEQGNWTPAAVGFARKQGLEPDALSVVETPKGPRLCLRNTQRGANLGDSFNEIIHDSIRDLPIPKRMRWGASRVEFVRPVHWVVAMLGSESQFGEVLGLPTGNTTRGHRFHSHGIITLNRPEEYQAKLAEAKVIAN
ncbi:MAG: glycine--tRNA ligase subunit beta, partial [Haliea sp.]|nr:glycine--tRNA ligase subunit beta [Haliea sp.]